MSTELPVTGVVAINRMRGEDDHETALLESMAQQAQAFLAEFGWCKEITDFYFGNGIGGVFAVFFARIQLTRPEIDEYLWVIVGDIPPAYLVIDVCRTPAEAMSAYIEEMRRWVAAAKAGRMSGDIIPVDVPATPETVQLLETRLDVLERDILPAWFGECR